MAKSAGKKNKLTSMLVTTLTQMLVTYPQKMGLLTFMLVGFNGFMRFFSFEVTNIQVSAYIIYHPS